jgi:hypothetical protein
VAGTGVAPLQSAASYHLAFRLIFEKIAEKWYGILLIMNVSDSIVEDGEQLLTTFVNLDALWSKDFILDPGLRPCAR